MSGFVPMQASWWETIRASIPKPWPREAAAMDLRWHADRAAPRPSWRPIQFPGRPTLAAEWGWTDWAVKQLLRDEAMWADNVTNGDSASEPPARRQRTASAPPAADRANAEKTEETASAPPADRQRAASKPPRARSSEHPTPNTQGDTPARPVEAPDGEPAPATAVDPRLVEVIGTRADLLRLLVAPMDPKDAPIRDLDALRRTPLSADGPDLVHRVGMGPQRARQLAELLEAAGVPLIAERHPEGTGPPPRAAPAAERRQATLDALRTARERLASGATNALP